MQTKIFQIFILSLLISSSALGQVQKDRDVIGSAGEFSTSPTLQISWTVGEAAILTQQNGNLMVTEGFQQADVNITSIGKVDFSGEIKVFPNPTTDLINFDILTSKDTEMSGELFDATGKRILEISSFDVYSEYQGQIDFSHLPAGKFFLRFTDKQNKTFKTFTVVKVR